MHFTDKELEIINNQEFLRTKISIFEKLHALFGEVQRHQKEVISKSIINFPKDVDIQNGKIFKGENYRSLPYLVLDYPKLYSKNNTFSYRTMFLWGHYFSSTLHLEGESLEKYRDVIIKNISRIIHDDEIYLCINESPWEYYFTNDNYILLEKENLDLIRTVKYLKLSRKYDLTDHENIPQLSSYFLEKCLSILTSK